MKTNDNSNIRIKIERNAQAGKFNKEFIELLIDGLKDPDPGIKDVCSRAILTISEDLIDEIVIPIADLITNENIEIRNLAGDILSKMGEHASNALLPYLNSPEAIIRSFTCDLIGNIGDGKFSSNISKLLNDENENVVISAIETLGKFRSENEISQLIQLFDKNDNFKPMILNTLGKIGGKDAQEFLLNILKSENNEFIQSICVDALAETANDKQLCEEFLEKLPSLPEAMQPVFLKTIYSIAERLNIEFLLPDTCRHAARKALDDDDPDISAAGLIALGKTYNKEDFPYLIKEILKNQEETSKHIIYNLIKYSDISECRHFFLELSASNRPDTTDNDLLGFVSGFWQIIPDEKKLCFTDILIEVCFTPVKAYAKDIIDTMYLLAPNLVTSKLKEFIGKGNSEQKEEANEILLVLSNNSLI